MRSIVKGADWIVWIANRLLGLWKSGMETYCARRCVSLFNITLICT